MKADDIYFTLKSSGNSDEASEYEKDDIEDMNTIIKKLDFDLEIPKDQDIFALNNKFYNVFTDKFNNEIDYYLFHR